MTRDAVHTAGSTDQDGTPHGGGPSAEPLPPVRPIGTQPVSSGFWEPPQT